MTQNTNSIMTKPLDPNSIPPETLAYFNSTPWTASLLSSSSSSSSADSDYYPIQTYSRQFKSTTGEDGFFAKTLGTTTTIPHVLTLRRRNITPPPPPPPPSSAPIWPSPTEPPQTTLPSTQPPDVQMLLGLSSPGISGHPSTAHGGVLATLIDETMSLAVTLHGGLNPGDLHRPRGHIFTAQLDVRYKRPVAVPGVVVVRAKVVRRVGRKSWVRAQVVQGVDVDSGSESQSQSQEPLVMVDAMAFWLETKARL